MGITVYSLLWVMQDLVHQQVLSINHLRPLVSGTLVSLYLGVRIPLFGSSVQFRTEYPKL